jgi:hypothetical protein
MRFHESIRFLYGWENVPAPPCSSLPQGVDLEAASTRAPWTEGDSVKRAVTITVNGVSHTTGEYRAHLASVPVRRALQAAMAG